MVDEVKKSRRGLASMSPERRREIASLGGRSVPKEKRAFSDRQLARSAGKLGAKAKHASKASLGPMVTQALTEGEA